MTQPEPRQPSLEARRLAREVRLESLIAEIELSVAGVCPTHVAPVHVSKYHRRLFAAARDALQALRAERDALNDDVAKLLDHVCGDCRAEAAEAEVRRLRDALQALISG